MDLVLARGLGKGFPGFKLTYHLPCELTGEATPFESHGCGLLSDDQEA
jgi:hypothetical protein